MIGNVIIIIQYITNDYRQLNKKQERGFPPLNCFSHTVISTTQIIKKFSTPHIF